MLRKRVRESDPDLVAGPGCFLGPAFKALPVPPNSPRRGVYNILLTSALTPDGGLINGVGALSKRRLVEKAPCRKGPSFATSLSQGKHLKGKCGPVTWFNILISDRQFWSYLY